MLTRAAKRAARLGVLAKVAVAATLMGIGLIATTGITAPAANAQRCYEPGPWCGGGGWGPGYPGPGYLPPPPPPPLVFVGGFGPAYGPPPFAQCCGCSC